MALRRNSRKTDSKEITSEMQQEYDALQTALKETREKIEVMENQNKNLPSRHFAGLAKDLFDKNPDLVSFAWRQYTPYFNDGDTCYFSAHTEYPKINGVEIDNDWDEADIEEGEGADEAPQPLTAERRETLDEEVSGFLGRFSDDQLMEWFGDHSEIAVTRKGVTVSGYDHD